MLRRILVAVFVLTLVVGFSRADYKGTIAKVNLKSNLLTIQKGADPDDTEVFVVGKDIKIVDKDGAELKDGIKNEIFKVGASVAVKTEGKGKKAKIVEVMVVQPAK
jgi:hypothetical protein